MGTASYHKVKPLPPTPTLRVPSPGSSRASSTFSSRRPSFASSRTHSTTSSIYTEDVPPAPKYLPFRKDTLLPSAWFESDSIRDRSSTLEVPDALLSGPKPSSDAKTQPVLQKPAKIRKGPPESLFSEWKPPKYRDSGDNDNDEIRALVPENVLVKNSRETQHVAEQHANDYQSILARASTMPSSDYEPYYDGYNSLPTPMSPRVTDVVDETLVPRPLRKSIAVDSGISSHFSDSSGHFALKEEYRDPLKSGAKKAFHSHRFSQDKGTMKSTDSHTSSLTSSIEGRCEVVSMTPSERASIQRGIIGMYDSLTSLYDPLKQHAPAPEAKPKIGIALPERNVLHKDFQSPAIPRTPYHRHEPNAWDDTESPLQSSITMSVHQDWSPASPAASTPKKSHFSQSSQEISSKESHSSLSLAERKKKKIKTYSLRDTETRPKGDRSMSGKLKKAVGLEGKKIKQTEDEKRREEMKKKIVIVEAIEQGPFLVEK